MDTLSLTRLLFRRPTAPFCEKHLLLEIEAIAKNHRLPHFYDSSGNLIVGVSNKRALATGSRLLLFAHTDHPGFILQSQKGKTAKAKWFGGAPFEKMKGARVRIFNRDTGLPLSVGHVSYIKTKPYNRKGMPLNISLEKPLEAAPCYGAFDFPGIRVSGNRIRTRAADDIAGCVIALGSLLDQKHSKGSVVGIFTRAEEVGFVGCWSFLKSTRISSKSMAISLEASRTMAGARLGQGPVLRLGDRSTLFDQDPSQFLLLCAEKMKKKNRKFKFQRRIMDGGSCEATALSLFGVSTTGLAVPLKNYHNMGARGPAPEIIDYRDLDAARHLCSLAAREIQGWNTHSSKTRNQLEGNFRSLKGYLDLHPKD